MRYLVDPRVVDGSALVTGRAQPSRDRSTRGRDFRADGTIDVAEVRLAIPARSAAFQGTVEVRRVSVFWDTFSSL